MKRYINKQDCETVLMARAGKFRFKWQGEDGRIRLEFYRNGLLIAETEREVLRGKNDETRPFQELTEGLYEIRIYRMPEGQPEREPCQILNNIRVGAPYEIAVKKEEACDYGMQGTGISIEVRYGSPEELAKLHFYYRVKGIKYRVPMEYWKGFFVQKIPLRDFRLECEENSFCRNLTCRIV